ncbi:MAG: hypothetical protein IKS08_00300 [Alphaproteobacteria bacterium]|nr:hypothetical protein [Alphaproteobacteria bacterium]
MKNILLILAFLIGGFDAYAARVGSAPNARSNTSSPAASGANNSTGTNGVRAARTSGVRGRSTTPAPTSNDTVSKTVGSRGRSATAQTTPTVKARAGTKQNVINSGTKVATAAQNTVVDEECWNKFSGCMDSFCMLDNATGGRCICSDKNAEYDSILAEIQELDNQSYQMATVGVERIEMGDDADAVMARTKAITNSIEKDAEKAKSKRQSLDLSAWNTDSGIDFDEDVEDIFSLSSDGVSVANKKGDALYRASAKLCTAQLKECSAQHKMMELMYQQRIRSDCTAYENSLRQQRTQSAQKLAAAQSAMREAALEQYRNANKYDLGQCTVEFKKCMQTTGGCGDDFTGCVTQQTTRETLQGGKIKMKKIKGASTTIEIAAWTYDALESKKPLCMTVTQQCVNVKDQVWDTFLREVAPQVKSAELAAESDLRMSCISTISDCFQKACKENMDPNNPDGSYDICLTRPETLRSFCKVQIDPCEAAEPKIMDYVRARLASMRVDSCTKEFKECLQSEDRCGADYSQCVGLDTDTIVRMCPAEKLVGCQYDDAGSDGSARTNKSAQVKTDDEIYDELARIAQGIFLNIDNNMLTTCQKAADAAMIKVCGSTEDCDDLVIDDRAGTRSFKYQVCQFDGLQGDGKTAGVGSASNSTAGMPNWTGQCYDSLDAITEAQLKQDGQKGWAGKLSGLVYWGEIEYDVDKNSFTTEKEYLSRLASLNHTFDDDEKEIIHERVFGTEIRALTRAVEQAVSAIESDPKVQYCMSGRTFQGMRDKDGQLAKLGTQNKDEARFPKLTDQIRRMIATSALKNARNNYMKKYDEEITRMMKDQVKAAERLDEQASKELALKQAEQSCADWANNTVLPVSKAPKASNAGRWIAVGVIAAVAVVASIFTFGAAGVAGAAAIAGITAAATTAGTAATIAAGVAVAATGTAAGLAATTKPVGKAEIDQWNYKESVSTTFNYQTGECFKTKVTQNCKKIKKNYCKEWDEEVEETTSINLLDNE